MREISFLCYISPMSPSSPIGFFDSGIGGLTIRHEVMRLLPHESTVYIADRAHCPYGRRSVEEITVLSKQCTERLLERGCKLVVVACNTATAAAIDTLRADYPHVPFVGMEPAVKPAALHSKTGIIGILATEGTFNGRLFRETSERFAKGVRVETCVGTGFVELVEAGKAETEEARRAVEAVLRPLLDKGIDHLVLGCTHYPYLLPHIRDIAGPGVAIIDPSPAIARRVEQLLAERNLLAPIGAVARHELIGELPI